MIRISLDQLLNNVGNRYAAVQAVTKRAVEIINHRDKLILTDQPIPTNPIGQAFNEICEGKITVKMPEDKKKNKQGVKPKE